MAEGGWVRSFCEQHCSYEPRGEVYGFFTAAELRKVRQKRPPISLDYQITPLRPSKFRQGLRDIADINAMIDRL